jgi:hypothetical protein
MNKQIQELAVEARLITVDGITRYALDHEFEQRFAELIVYECIDLALGSSRREDDMGAIIASKIKKHFEVNLGGRQ